MSRKSARKTLLSTVGLGVEIWGGSVGRAIDPVPPRPSAIVLVQKKDDEPPQKKDDLPPLKKDTISPPVAPIFAPLAPALPPTLNLGGGGTATPPANTGTDLSTRSQGTAAGDTTASIAVAANQAPQVLNAADLSQLLFKSSASTGIQFQQRNPLVNDPRIRGLRNTQYLLYGDSAFFAPVRLDLDTPVTRSIRARSATSSW